MTARTGLLGVMGAIAAALAWPGVHPSAQQAARSPAFKSGIDLIAIDANVVDRNGQPVRGLDAGAFQVTIDGKPRRVASATFLDYRSSGPAPLAARPLRLEDSYSSNEVDAAPAATPGRVVVLAVDQMSFAPGASRAALESARRFLDRLQPSDRVGLLAYPGPGPGIAPTTDRQAVRNALEKVTGMADIVPSTSPHVSLSEAVEVDRGSTYVRQSVIDRECAGLSGQSLEGCARQVDAAVPGLVNQIQVQASRSMGGLQSVIRRLDAIGGPKTLVVISAGLAAPLTGRFDLRGEIQALAEAASTANLRIYVLHVSAGFLQAFSAEHSRVSATVLEDESLMSSGLQMLAAMSAGTLFTAVSGADYAFERMATETSAAYVLAVEPEPADRDGKAHKIQVKVNVPGSTVRSRASFVVPAAAPAPSTPAEAVGAALKSVRLAKDLPIHLTTHTLRDSASGQMQVILTANIGRGVIGPADVRVGYAVADQSGQVLGAASDTARLEPVGTGPEAAWSYVNSLALRPGSYVIRVAAAAADGRTGSVERQVEARLAAGDGVSLSDLVIFDPRRPVKLGWAAFVEGRTDGASIGAFVETYPVRGKSLSSVAFDIADLPDGAPIVGVRAKPVSADGGRRWTASAVIDVRLLPPGDYVAVATVFDGDKRLGRVSRPFRRAPMPGGGAGGPRAAFEVAESGGIVRAFSRQDALAPGALQFFLARQKDADGGPASDALTAAAAAVQGGRFDVAIAALSNSPADRLSVPFLRGLALFGRGDLEPAAAQFREALRVSSEFLPAAFYLGACYAAGGRDREAAGAWQTSLVSESEARIVYDVLADAWLRIGDGEQAESIASEAAGRWPADDGFLPRVAAARAMQGRGREALVGLAPYLEQHPADASALFLALRILYDAHAAGGTVTSPVEDAALATKYAAAYRSAGGPRLALVDRWAAFIERPRAGR